MQANSPAQAICPPGPSARGDRTDRGLTGTPESGGSARTSVAMNATVGAINSLSIFGPHQAGAYREHSRGAVAVLGPGIETHIGRYVADWAVGGADGLLVLTGNAGTG